MDCTDIRPLISYYFDGEATPEEHARVEQHLATCAACRKVLAEYRVIGSDLRDLPMPIPPVGLRRDVWRRIEAQQGAVTPPIPPPKAARPAGNVVNFPQRRSNPLAGVFGGMSGGWAKVLTAALLVGALFIVMAVLVVMQNSRTVAAALVDSGPFSSYTQTVEVRFGRSVQPSDAENMTQVYKPGGAVMTDSEIVKRYHRGTNGGTLTIEPVTQWEPGATYEVTIDAANIRRDGVNDRLGTEMIRQKFSTLAYTPTPTATAEPTNTPQPTATAPAQPTVEPTAVAQNSPVVVDVTATAGIPPATTNTPAPPQPSNTPLPQPTNTPVAPSATPIPPTATPVSPSATPVPPSATTTSEPSAPTVTSTGTATATATPRRGTATPTPSVTGTATATPRRGTPTPVPPCEVMPVNGFGKVWNEHPQIKQNFGCPVEHETAIQTAAAQHFQGGYMLWRGDTKMIYVFVGGPNDTIGTWYEFPDRWVEGEPVPQSTATPVVNQFGPVRGFGKLYYDPANEWLRIALGAPTDAETGVTAAWQGYEQGYALWTSDRQIRFMERTMLWWRFEDTFVMPTSTPPTR